MPFLFLFLILCFCRQNTDGSAVKTYEEFISYLCRKNEKIEAVEMDFGGRNILLYYLADIRPLSNPEEAIPRIVRGPAKLPEVN
jgi:hypothetical protein